MRSIAGGRLQAHENQKDTKLDEVNINIGHTLSIRLCEVNLDDKLVDAQNICLH